jgi:hypothetical protein
MRHRGARTAFLQLPREVSAAAARAVTLSPMPCSRDRLFSALWCKENEPAKAVRSSGVASIMCGRGIADHGRERAELVRKALKRKLTARFVFDAMCTHDCTTRAAITTIAAVANAPSCRPATCRSPRSRRRSAGSRRRSDVRG